MARPDLVRKPKFAERIANDPDSLRKFLERAREATKNGVVHLSTLRGILVDQFGASEREAERFVSSLLRRGEAPINELLITTRSFYGDSKVMLTRKALALLSGICVDKTG